MPRLGVIAARGVDSLFSLTAALTKGSHYSDFVFICLCLYPFISITKSIGGQYSTLLDPDWSWRKATGAASVMPVTFIVCRLGRGSVW